MLVSICIYGLLLYNLIHQLDADADADSHGHRHLPRPRHRYRENDSNSEQSQTNRITGSRLTQAIRIERASSIDYFSCCGAGHRLSKIADVYYVAKQLKFTVRVFFGFCSHQEVFSYFFGLRPLNEVQVLNSINDIAANAVTGPSPVNMPHDIDMYIKVSNEAPGFKKITRHGSSSNSTMTCPCRDGDRRFDSDIELFTDLRDNRFRSRDKVDSFRKKFFVGHTVIGLHIRAGNGEQGDFFRKNRTIQDTDQWCVSMSNLLISMSNDFPEKEPLLLFIATDTAAIISKLRAMLKDKMEVVDLKQDRIDRGQGVLFGAFGNVHDNGDKCKNGWLDSFADMMILSHADVLVAGRPSSFTQSLPMTLALSTPKSERKVLKSFCEVNPEANAVMCFEDLKDWCCNGNTSFSLHTIQKYDYRRMPQLGGLDLEEYTKQLKMRPRAVQDCIPKTTGNRECLPYEMPNEKRMLEFQKSRRVKKVPRQKQNN